MALRGGSAVTKTFFGCVRHADDRTFRNARQGFNDWLDLGRIDVEAARDDQVFARRTMAM
jgi:hypothetical protein